MKRQAIGLLALVMACCFVMSMTATATIANVSKPAVLTVTHAPPTLVTINSGQAKIHRAKARAAPQPAQTPQNNIAQPRPLLARSNVKIRPDEIQENAPIVVYTSLPGKPAAPPPRHEQLLC